MKTDLMLIVSAIEKAIENREGYFNVQVEADAGIHVFDVVAKISVKTEEEIGGEVGEILRTISSRDVMVCSMIKTEENGRMYVDTPELISLGNRIEEYFKI